MTSKDSSNSLIRGVLIGSICGVVVGALATTLAGQMVLSLIGKLWNKITRREEGVDFRWLLQ